jgi:phosphatidylserine decarboxylase
MVKDGIYYGLGMIVAAVVIWYFTQPSPWQFLAIIPLLLAAFFLWFFRDPERQIPTEPGLVVSPADGTVTDVSNFGSEAKTRISIFLNVFNVHVNRSPIAGIVTAVTYQKGKFGNAMAGHSSEHNEQNIVTVEGEGHSVTFKQIAGLLARRIVFDKKMGDTVSRGERIGLIKFGSRVDVVLNRGVNPTVKVGDKVSGGSSIIARVEPGQ